MTTIDWSKTDDYQFVKLTTDLLDRLGFVDIDQQGAGPDGGIDILATELIPFAIQGRKPFRWAIQCKFSALGLKGSVNDRDVQDVEGILRSERYTAQEIRGYLLVTNRQIVQNVVERLRGIDRNSNWRTARVDGAALESLLFEHPRLINRYFPSPESDRGALGTPRLIATPIATGRSGKRLSKVAVEVRNPTNGVVVKTDAIIDTGAEMTTIPRQVAEELGPTIDGYVSVGTVSGSPTQHRTVTVDLVVERLLFSNVTMVEVDLPYILLGQDVLSGLRILLEPDGAVFVYDERK